jgi:hypothetical protein
MRIHIHHKSGGCSTTCNYPSCRWGNPTPSLDDAHTQRNVSMKPNEGEEEGGGDREDPQDEGEGEGGGDREGDREEPQDKGEEDPAPKSGFSPRLNAADSWSILVLLPDTRKRPSSASERGRTRKRRHCAKTGSMHCFSQPSPAPVAGSVAGRDAAGAGAAEDGVARVATVGTIAAGIYPFAPVATFCTYVCDGISATSTRRTMHVALRLALASAFPSAFPSARARARESETERQR